MVFAMVNITGERGGGIEEGSGVDQGKWGGIDTIFTKVSDGMGRLAVVQIGDLTETYILPDEHVELW